MKTIKQLRDSLDNREISAVELAEVYLSNIKNKDDVIGAYLHVNEEVTRKMAQDAQKRIDAGEKSPMLGIPVGLKDNLSTTDMPTTCASRFLEGYTSPYDATVVRKLREAGAVITGKLNMDEFSMGASTMTSAYKRTANPYNTNCIPGGSSGGAAAAVAAEMCAVALGSDTGGSVRQPAALCGVTGLKPTYGTVSRYGVVAYAPSMDQVATMGLSAEDCGLLLDVISGRDDNDMIMSKGHDMRPAVDSVKGLKIGVIEDLMSDQIEAEVREAVLGAIDWYKQNGAEIHYVTIPNLKLSLPAYSIIVAAEVSSTLGRFDGVRFGRRAEGYSNYDELIEKSRGEGFGHLAQLRILQGIHVLCQGNYDAYFKKAHQYANYLSGEFKSLYQKYDALLLPTSPFVAWPFDKVPDDPSLAYLADLCTVSAPLAGLPAVSTPCGYSSDGLPIGLQIIGNRFDDKFILSLASLFEKDFERREATI